MSPASRFLFSHFCSEHAQSERLSCCFQSMFDATLKERHKSFNLAPGTFIFIRWLVGMVYVFYFASFILLLREVLRPGVLWFLRNLNDPDFNPIQEVRHLILVILIELESGSGKYEESERLLPCVIIVVSRCVVTINSVTRDKQLLAVIKCLTLKRGCLFFYCKI